MFGIRLVIPTAVYLLLCMTWSGQKLGYGRLRREEVQRFFTLRSRSHPFMNWYMENISRWKTANANHAVIFFFSVTSASTCSVWKLMGTWLTGLTNRWWIGLSHSCMCTYRRTCTHTHRWWNELPCWVDLYQSRDMKLNCQTKSCTPTPTSALCRLCIFVPI